MPSTSAAVSTRAAWWGLGVAIALVVAAVAVPAAADWDVQALSFPPLRGEWEPRLGPGTVPALVVAALAVVYAGRACERWPWPRVLAGAFALCLAWQVSLATVDGWSGIGTVLANKNEYLGTAHTITSWADVSDNLHEYVSRIPLYRLDHWPVHIAGHPPGALLVFVLLVTIGLGSGLAAGCVVIVLAATTPVAVLLTLRRLAAEPAARRAAPFVAVGPAAVWTAVSGDALFGAVAAWGLCCLAMAATSRGRWPVAGWGVSAGLLLGYCVLLSYGLVLLAIPAVGILVAARSWRPLPWAAAAAVAVVAAFALAGFSWWEAYPVLRERYWDGIARRRPASYWVWGDLAALALSAGPLVGSALAVTMAGRAGAAAETPSGQRRVVCWLALTAFASILVADASLMSKAEVERIWLPFVPWLLVGCALLPQRWRRWGLAGQIVCALAVQHLLFTPW